MTQFNRANYHPSNKLRVVARSKIVAQMFTSIHMLDNERSRTVTTTTSLHGATIGDLVVVGAIGDDLNQIIELALTKGKMRVARISKPSDEVIFG